VLVPLGTSVISLTVDDGGGLTAQDEVVVTVADTTPPTVTTAYAVPDALWPPNHKMHEIAWVITAEDQCDDTEPTATLVAISSDESEDGWASGDGNTMNDIQVDAAGHVFLRSERAGKGDGRVYTLSFEVTDTAGNIALALCTVEVPHDASLHACENPDCDLNINNQ